MSKTHDSQSIYLDFAAATPMHQEVKAAMEPYLVGSFYNPSAAYLAARALKKDIANARQSIAHWLGSKPAEIVFTAGVTESVNLAIQGIMRKHPSGKILVGATEHDAVLEVAQQFNHEIISVRPDGHISFDELNKHLTDDVVLVSLMYANNETGVIHPLKDIAATLELARKERQASNIETPLYFHTDAAQATNYLDMHVSRLGVDLMSINGAKIYGPKQTGALCIRGGTELEPLIYGGGQERNMRGGTENVAGIIGFAKAMDIAQSKRVEEVQRLSQLRDMFESKVLEATKAEVNGSTKHRLPNISNLTFGDVDGERIVQELDEQGLMVATGAACSAADEGPSHVLKAMGLSDSAANGSLRISFGASTTEQQVRRAAELIISTVS